MFELTSGTPNGAEQNINYTINDNMPDGHDIISIHSYTYQELDNGYLRFTMDYTMPAGLSVYVFNPPEGDLIGLWGSGTTSQDRSTLQFDIPADDLLSAGELNGYFSS